MDAQPRLFVAYVPGLDARRLDAQRTPFLHELRASFPPIALRTLPTTELLPTLITGVHPHEHGIWQVRLKPEARSMPPPRWSDRLPDVFSTTLQCLRQFTDLSYDLAAVPARRRRDFDLARFKYTRRERDGRVMETIGASESLFGILGERSRYRFTKRFGALATLGEELPTARYQLELLEMYALDLFEHWHMDQSEALDRAYRKTDDFVRQVHANARARGVSLMVLVDHGQEPVVGTIPLARMLRTPGLAEREYSCFIEAAMARFWFHTDRARTQIREGLARLSHTRVLSWRDLAAYGIHFEDDSFGEIYACADPGWLFFPHDFYQPLANLFLGLSDPHQRPRAFQPRHRGNHGYLPEHPSERGFVLLADEAWRASRSEMSIVDFAPSVLTLLGHAAPSRMRGSPAFTPRTGETAA
jgi:predicted AlkP superfamily pyrophosphatase or phosphodiesterase